MAVKKDEKTGTWYFYGSYKMKNGKYRQYKKRGFPKKKDAVKAEIIFKENVKDPYKNITLEELFNDIYKFLALYFPLFFIHLVYFMFSYFLVFDHILFN